MRKVIIGLAILLLLAIPARAEEVLLQPDDNSFSVKLPAGAEVGKPDTKRGSSSYGPVKVYAWFVEMGDEWYVVSYTEFEPDALATLDVNRTLEDARESAVKRVNGRTESWDAVTLRGSPGVTFRYTAKPQGAAETLYSRATIVMVGNRMYQVTYYSPKKTDRDGTNAKRFFDSFTIKK